MNNAKERLLNGLLKENPTFVLMLGMCPTLATTTSAMNGMSMGLATMAVLICTNFVISCIKSLTPDKVRIPVFVVVIASFVIVGVKGLNFGLDFTGGVTLEVEYPNDIELQSFSRMDGHQRHLVIGAAIITVKIGEQ